MKYFLSNLPAILIYSVTFYFLMIPLAIHCDFWIPNISIASSLGFLCAFLNAKFKTTGDPKGNFSKKDSE